MTTTHRIFAGHALPENTRLNIRSQRVFHGAVSHIRGNCTVPHCVAHIAVTDCGIHRYCNRRAAIIGMTNHVLSDGIGLLNAPTGFQGNSRQVQRKRAIVIGDDLGCDGVNRPALAVQEILCRSVNNILIGECLAQRTLGIRLSNTEDVLVLAQILAVQTG